MSVNRRNRCKHCARPVQEIEGRWYHTWWRKDPDDELRRVVSGSSECIFVGRPAVVPTHAEPGV